MPRTRKPWSSHLCFIVTWPYFRALDSHTFTPANGILDSSNDNELGANVERWKDVRIKELNVVTMAVRSFLSFCGRAELWMRSPKHNINEDLVGHPVRRRNHRRLLMVIHTTDILGSASFLLHQPVTLHNGRCDCRPTNAGHIFVVDRVGNP